MNKQLEEVLQKKEIKPTAMRLLVLEFMLNSPVAVSLHDLEREFQYSDRTTLFRTLKTFEQQLLIHRINDGTGSVKYALCHGDCVGSEHTDLHLHFYCNACKETICLPKTSVPKLSLPSSYQLEEVSLIAKGMCSNCTKNAT